jgi:hypothetical protein
MRDHMGGDMWGYMRDMEARFLRQTEEQQTQIARLEGEVTTLRAQLAQAGGQSQSGTQSQSQKPQLPQSIPQVQQQGAH